MSGWASWFGGGRKDSRESARDAIVGLRQQLLMLEKKEEFLGKKIEEEQKKARANATSNKRCKWRWHQMSGLCFCGETQADRQWPWPRSGRSRHMRMSLTELRGQD